MTPASDRTRLFLAAVAICALTASAAAKPVAPAARGEASDSAAAVPAPEYRIGPGDTLDVNVFDVSDLTRTVQVDSDGKILLPLIGQVMAGGLTPAQLSGRLARRLEATYLKDPQVTVTVKDAVSQKVTVDGAVIDPGVYPLAGPTTLLQAVALAKGADPKSAKNQVFLIRRSNGVLSRTTYNLAAIREGRAADPPIQASDIIVVPSSSGKAFMRTLEGLSPMIGALGWLRP
ncbi:MAG TPA: polysaccharide biosynthesis/export family protein [Caulobacteraceae bacterium]|nr:polysaccharide biosynthesis/export family protein [Caulobacteraceae bacterium]